MCYVNLLEKYICLLIHPRRVRVFFIDEKNNFFYPMHGGDFLYVYQRGGG